MMSSPMTRASILPLLSIALSSLFLSNVDAQTWARSFAAGSDVRGRALCRGAAGDLLVIGSTPDSALATRLDPFGNQEQQVAYIRILGSMRVQDVAADSLGDFYMVGHENGSPLVFRIDGRTDGVLWSAKTMVDDGEYHAVAMGEDDELLAVGFTVRGGQTDGLVTRFDDNGNVLWQRQVGGPLADLLDDAIAVEDGWIVSGRTQSYGVGEGDLWLVKFDEQGQVVWARTYGTTGLEALFSSPRLVSSGRGDLYVSASMINIANATQDYWILKLDEEGDVQWEKRADTGRDDIPQAIALTSDGGVVVGGDSGSGVSADIWLIKLSSRGDLVWQRSYGGARAEALSDMMPFQGGFIMVGTSDSFGYLDTAQWTVRLDSEGNNSKCCPYVFSGQGVVSDVSTLGFDQTPDLRADHTDLVGIVMSTIVTTESDFQCATNAGQWTHLGQSLPGKYGPPCLVGLGSLKPDSPVGTLLTQAREDTVAMLVAGIAPLEEPIFGGTLVPAPLLMLRFLLGSSGEHQFEDIWPLGAPAGAEIYLQYLVIDDQAVEGIAFSNAVRGVSQ